MTGNEAQERPAVHVYRGSLTFDGSITTEALKEDTGSFLTELTKALKGNGCQLIGHIKVSSIPCLFDPSSDNRLVVIGIHV